MTTGRIPSDVRDPLAVGRPGRLCLRTIRWVDHTRSAARIVHDVEIIQRHEGESRPLGGRGPVPDLAHRKRLCVLDRVIELDQGPCSHISSYSERDRDWVSTIRDWDTPDLSTVRCDNLPRIRSKTHARIGISISDRLLIVPLHRVRQPALVTRREVTEPKASLALVSRGIDEPRTVG